MPRPRRSLELAGSSDYVINTIPVDNTRVSTPVVNYEVQKSFFKPHDKYLYDAVFTDADAVPYRLIETRPTVFKKKYLTQEEINSFINKKKRAEVNNALKRLNRKDGGSIHIDPSKHGTFTAAATKHRMGVQEFASKVLRNKENYSPSLVKKANFARNASKWH